MPWNGDGTFTQTVGPSPVFNGPDVWTQDANASILIESARHDYHDQDLADGINACLNKNGANSPTSNIDWGGFQITSLAAGGSPTAAANVAQTITAASLDPTSNLLTLTRAVGDVTVDLTSLVIGGSTANFAKLNASDNAFTGQAEFGGTLGCVDALTILDPLTTSGATYTWAIAPPTATHLQISNTAGASLDFSGNSGAASLSVNGSAVWTAASLPSSTFTGVLKSTDNATITGVWTFAGGSVLLPNAIVTGGGVNSWTITTPSSSTKQIFFNSNFSSASVKFDFDVTEGTRLFADSHRVWTNNNWRVIASATPTGGVANDVALVLGGANQGLWANVAGTWTKIIAGP